MTENLKKIDWKVIIGIVVLIVIFVSYWINKQEQNKRWTQTSCPSLLSISRSSRDTLIIMKVEPLCNSYVLSNLQ